MAAIAVVSASVAPAAAVAFTSRVARVRPSSVSMAKAFGLKSRSMGRVTCEAYKITVKTPDGEISFECPDDVYILDAAEEAGHDLPYSCRAGSCSSCAGKMISGEVEDEGQFLNEEQKSQGFVLTCVAYPLSDVKLESHMEEELN